MTHWMGRKGLPRKRPMHRYTLRRRYLNIVDIQVSIHVGSRGHAKILCIPTRSRQHILKIAFCIETRPSILTMKTFVIVAAIAYFVTFLSGSVEAADPDQHEQCQFWAESGECDSVSMEFVGRFLPLSPGNHGSWLVSPRCASHAVLFRV